MLIEGMLIEGFDCICIYILYMAGLEYSRHMHIDKSGKPAIVSPLEPVATEVVFSAGMRRRRHPR